MAIRLTVLSPEKQLVSCEVSRVEFPGSKGRFVVLDRHDSLISSLTGGKICYTTAAGDECELAIRSGFVKVRDNIVTACVEL